ncbi:10240_t:CDS:2 [Cetraspora pellucida]|uniref:10240_t:CDS:1 n=1 Tax=Cetraspora pellucida TaxID=1433469 RepID=A0A9N8ZAV4_9GLOM|nr:10240_t:CDS:2 [Cetraspora pellucida]
MCKKFGVEYYIAPEVLMDHKMVTQAADVYSLGRCMDPNPKKRPTAKSVNFLIGYWIEEILSSDEDNKIKNKVLEVYNILQIIDTLKNSALMSKPIDIIDISE